MVHTSLRRQVLFLLLGVLLSLPWSASAEPRHTARVALTAHSPTLLELAGRAWSLLVNIWGKEGSMIDPDGRAANLMAGPAGRGQSTASPNDSGSMIDRNGHH